MVNSTCCIVMTVLDLKCYESEDDGADQLLTQQKFNYNMIV